MTATRIDIDAAESELLRKVLDTLLREDHLGMTTSGELVVAPPTWAGAWWRAPLPGGREAFLPVRAGGYLSDYEVREPVLLVVDGSGVTRERPDLAGALSELTPQDDPEAEAGWAAFTGECSQTLDTIRLHEAIRPELHAELAHTDGTGFPGLLRHEALAALRDHPVHPTGRCRTGLSEPETRLYAPEFRPTFPLHWTVVPRNRLRLSGSLTGQLPSWWPSPSALGGHAGLDADHLAVPVHPLTAQRGLLSTVDSTLLAVTPTLSLRTVAVHDDPGVHLKLPMPTATLGARNRRTIQPGTLADGETVQALLQAILAAEPALRARILLADESKWLDSADELLAVLVRRYPPELARDTLVPAAALLAEDPHRPGTTLLDRLAAGDPWSWFDTYLTTLLDWHLALWLRYGVALEAHQQNITVASGPDGRTLRLVYKDNDGARIDCARLASALGLSAPFPVTPDVFTDRRIAASDPAELADMVVTITMHLCVASTIFEYAGEDHALRRELFTLARQRIEEALERWCDPADAGSRAAAALVRRRVLDADRFPVKAMVTAGTLLPKARLNCADINKYYRYSGPNYLRPASQGDLDVRG